MSCQMQNVQVQAIPIGLGQNGYKLSLRIASGHNIRSFAEYVSKCCGKCPSPSKCPSPNRLKCPSPSSEICPSPNEQIQIRVEGYEMGKEYDMIWLPLTRVAIITGKSVKTIRRMTSEGSLAAVKRTVASGKTHTTKTFVLADRELLDLELSHCQRHNQKAVHLNMERMTFGSEERDCLFITSYTNDVSPEE
ncbi:MAG: hypothetical protein PHY48_07865 [Candidatus Cloacimonetes bacterium]|nr:hypothetical protein [Candidatus Cloacimonadota bacterium]